MVQGMKGEQRMNLPKKTVFVAMLALTLLAIAPVSAHAVPACDRFGATDTICFFDLNSFGGGECDIRASAFVGTGWNNMDNACGPSFDNWMNSWINNSSHDGRWATGLNGNGTLYCLNANGQNASVSNPNTMSSFRIFSGSTVC
jgi:hypothetical protein